MKTKNISLCLHATLGVLLLTADITRAATLITPRSAKRSVGVFAKFVTPTNATASTTGFAPFDQTVHVGFINRYEPWSLDASQQSFITNSSITATGMVSLGFANALVNGYATNEFRFTFRLTSPANFTLGGSLVWDGLYGAGISGSPVVRLTGPLGIVFASAPVLNDATVLDFYTNGPLAAGQYTLESYAGVASDFAGGETMNFNVAFAATPVAAPVFNTHVYQLKTCLNGIVAPGARRMRLTSTALVNLALGLPSTNVPRDQLLALATDDLDHSAHIVVWDKSVTNIVAEIALVTFSPSLSDGTNFCAVASVPFNSNERLLDAADGIVSQLTFFAAGKLDGSDNIVRFAGSSVLGQLNTVTDAGVTNLTLIRSGIVSLGQKLGALP